MTDEVLVKTPNKAGETPFMIACRVGSSEDILKKLINMHDNACNDVDPNGRTPIFYAVENNQVEMVEWLIKRGVDIHVLDKEQRSLVHYAAIRDFFEIIFILSQKGINLSAVDIHQKTPLMLAEQKEHMASAILLEASASGSTFINSLLVLSVERNATNLIAFMFAKKIDGLLKHAESALIKAAYAGNTVILDQLLCFDVDPNASNEKTTALLSAVSAGHIDIVQKLLDKKANIEQCDISGRTPLQEAVISKNVRLFQLLIKRGANVDYINKVDGNNALMYAVSNEQIEFLKTILDISAKNLNHRNNMGYAPVHIAAARQNYKMLYTLFQKGADRSILTYESHSVFHICKTIALNFVQGYEYVYSSLNEKKSTLLMHFAATGCYTLIDFLLAKDGNINDVDYEKNTALIYATHSGSLEVASRLLDEGVDINAMNVEGFSALHVACLNGHKYYASYLIKKGATINLQTLQSAFGYTPLHCACLKGHVDIVYLLLANAANIALKDKQGQTPLDLINNPAGGKGVSQFVLTLMLSYVQSAESSPLMWAISNNEHALVLYLLDKGVDVDQTASNGLTALHIASQKGQRYYIDLLLTENAMINCADFDGATPLMHAASKGDLSSVMLLLNAGADFSQTCKNGKNALDYARLHQHDKVCEVIELAHTKQRDMCFHGMIAKMQDQVLFRQEMDSGLDVSLQDSKGNTLLHHAAQHGYFTQVHDLLCAGLDVHIKNKDGKMAAELTSHSGIKKLLLASAEKYNGEDIVKYFMRKADEEMLAFLREHIRVGANDELMKSMIETGNIEFLMRLDQKGVDFDMIYSCGKTALMIVAEKGFLEAFTFFFCDLI